MFHKSLRFAQRYKEDLPNNLIQPSDSTVKNVYGDCVCLGYQGQKWDGNPGFLHPGPVFFPPTALMMGGPTGVPHISLQSCPLVSFFQRHMFLSTVHRVR